jgi:hypothetical protein
MFDRKEIAVAQYMRKRESFTSFHFEKRSDEL